MIMTVETLQRKLEFMKSQRGKGVYKSEEQLEKYINYIKQKMARKIMKHNKYAHLRPKPEEPAEEPAKQRGGKRGKKRS